MLKRKLHLMLIATLIFSLSAPHITLAQSKEEKAAAFTGKVKAGIAKLGVGPEAQVRVKLRDKTKLKGYVSKIGEDSFTVTDGKTGVTTEVPYPDVTQIKGKNLTLCQWIIIGAIGWVVGAILITWVGGGFQV